ncbi:sugar phosphate isomerase/epimerase family protein [Metabacillus iocasae]|uniref:Sugar phosphate isomerase/epimerase n=1 Tax=Priestia iocasae TaxID=2291674 RepID=A0ABS2QVT3_9BACI|nr:sugar phosphate isomerase/epimerase [Metabacillus iocasae]MBM7703532.1 sugar phosphate isomerase/epimerase [Metabacillus iocasae]
MTHIPIALQLYTLRKETEQDFIGTLEKVAALGYEGVEFAGYGGLEASELKRVLDRLELKAVSSHVSIEELEENLDQVIEYQQGIGSTYIVCPYLPPERRTEDDYRQLISLLNHVGKRCANEGLTLLYHHHDFELVRFPDGRTPLEMILNETNPEWVKAEFDVYWLTISGERPVEWLTKYQGRTPVVHLKDMTVDDRKTFAKLGTGGVDLDAIVQQGSSSTIKWWIVEQDKCEGSALESVGESIRYLKTLLEK